MVYLRVLYTIYIYSRLNLFIYHVFNLIYYLLFCYCHTLSLFLDKILQKKKKIIKMLVGLQNCDNNNVTFYVGL